MIGSKLVPLVRGLMRTAGRPESKKFFSTGKSLQSGHAWFYREIGEPPKKNVMAAEFAGAIMWWWVFWHLFTEYEHITGEWDWPTASNFTDEELGIPPDDAEDPEFLEN